MELLHVVIYIETKKKLFESTDKMRSIFLLNSNRKSHIQFQHIYFEGSTVRVGLYSLIFVRHKGLY